MRSMRPILIVTAAAALLACSGPRPDTPLEAAALEGRTDDARALLAGGANPDGDGRGETPLILAGRGGHLDTLRVLLEHGADPRLRGGHNAWTPVMHAIHEHRDAVVVLLLDATTHPPDELASALRMAAGYANLAMVRELLDRGAVPDESALIDAVAGSWDIEYRWSGCEPHLETARMLLDRSPDLEMGDRIDAAMARWYVRWRGCDQILALLEGEREVGSVAAQGRTP